MVFRFGGHDSGNTPKSMVKSILKEHDEFLESIIAEKEEAFIKIEREVITMITNLNEISNHFVLQVEPITAARKAKELEDNKSAADNILYNLWLGRCCIIICGCYRQFGPVKFGDNHG